MKRPVLNVTLAGLALAMLLLSIAFAAVTEKGTGCDSQLDVVQAMDQSRNGISLSCNESMLKHD